MQPDRSCLAKLQDNISYHFNDIHLLEHAMRHTSFSNEQHMGRLSSNERLEFLGDAVLELAVSEYLYTHYPEMPEGKATKLRASLVCEQTLAACAREIGVNECLSLGKGEENTGGRSRESVTSDATEALIGAVYLDGSFSDAKEIIEHFILNDIEHKQLFIDSKTILQEELQAEKDRAPEYRIVKEEGPDHNKTFTVEVLSDGAVIGTGSGRSKKAAEQEAAYRALLYRGRLK